MKKLLYLIAVAGCLSMISCKNGESKSEGEANPDTAAATATAATAQAVQNADTIKTDNGNILIKPKGVIPNLEDGIYGDALEHKLPTIWPKQSIYVNQKGTELNILDIFTAIVEVYPIRQVLEGWYAIDQTSGHNSLGTFEYDEEKNYISGKWEDPDYGNNFALKAWEMMAENKWMIGFVYNYLYDGDDGVGVYQNLMFWTYDAINEHILHPVDTTECFLPVYTPQRGIVVFKKDNDNLDFEDGADPSLFWKWNGYWFESSAPME